MERRGSGSADVICYSSKTCGDDVMSDNSHICVLLPQGSGVIKAGFAGDQIPKYCFPN